MSQPALRRTSPVGTGPGLIVVAAAAVLFCLALAGTDLWAPDEPRYAQVADEMLGYEHGASGLVLPHLNGEPYTQKPPLYFWVAALFGWPVGRVTEVAGRLPSALAGIATVVLIWRFGSRLLGGASGLLGAAFLLTVYRFAEMARRVQLDVLLTLLEAVALVAFWRIDRGFGRRAVNVAIFHAAMGAAVLTKGPVGFLIPVLVVVAYLFWERRPRDLARAFPPWAFLLSLAPGLLWLVLASSLAPAGFIHEAVGMNILERFLSGTSHSRPVYYFLYQFPLDFLPWTLLWPIVFLAGRSVLPSGDTEPRRAWRFLLAWVGVAFVFFSLSSGKRGIYMLPAFPAAALLCADGLLRVVAARSSIPRLLTIPGTLVAAVLVVVGVLVSFAPPDSLPALPEVQRIGFGLGIAAVAMAGVATWWVLYARSARTSTRLAVPVACMFALNLLTFIVLYPALDAEKSPRPLAEAAAGLTGPGGHIGLVGDRALAGGLAYYGRRPVVEMKTADDIRAFFASGGRVIVVNHRKAGRVEAVRPIQIRARIRSGPREVWVVTPADPDLQASRPTPEATLP